MNTHPAALSHLHGANTAQGDTLLAELFVDSEIIADTATVVPSFMLCLGL